MAGENELLAMARLAKSILNDNTPYLRAKSLIRTLFTSPPDLPYDDLVELRLTLIDSFYGTNMSKRYYGIEDLSHALLGMGHDDQTVRTKFLHFLSSCSINAEMDSRVTQLFTNRYGLNKKGELSRRAPSLASKYAYFLCEFQFPIYDRLTVEMCLLFSSRYPELGVPPFDKDDPLAFFRAICTTNRIFQDFDLLDNLLWLVGKVREGNLSLIVSRDRFLQLKNAIDLPMTYDKVIAANNSERLFREAIGGQLSNFITFVEKLG
jgi:hypothetical protein